MGDTLPSPMVVRNTACPGLNQEILCYYRLPTAGGPDYLLQVIDN
jgi:hypothetical protein